MALPIGPTPVLEGEDAIKFLEKVNAEKDKKVSLRPTPKLEELRLKIIADAKRPKK